ncbi:MAG: hypothetical protein Q9M13_01355 [Mariprofundales bacterium]|nr:hypothetical protein [Mariprofundales bacterium]
MRVVRDFRLLLRRYSLGLWAVLIAFVLWFQVHGSGIGAFAIDAPLQVRGLSKQLMIINDLPETVRITVKGLQARINHLSRDDIRIIIDASDINNPGVMDRAINIQDVHLPAGMSIEKISPDRLQLQVDRLVARLLPVKAVVDLPEQWRVSQLKVVPLQVKVTGPEVWMDSISELDTAMVHPELKAGPFTMEVRVVSPTGRAIRMVDEAVRVQVTGVLTPVVQHSSKSP